MKNKFLLEIGTEEIPFRFIDEALKQLQNNNEKMLRENRIEFGEVTVYATPRRLVLIVEDIGETQADLEETVKGPAKRIAYDKDGNPSKALLGFARGQGVDLDNIIIKEYKGEEYVYAHKFISGGSSIEILKVKLAEIIKSIGFPKPMKWGGKNLKFARPIRWIMAIFNDKIIPFDLEGIQASNVTRGHRFLGSSNIVIDNVNEYLSKLEENYVIVEDNKRRSMIKTGCDKLAKEKGGNVLEDEELLDELTYIVEYPTPLIGRIKEEYLSLPKEVITTPMKEHQRYYPVVDDNGNLMPYFIAVRNGDENYIDIVTKGNEKVLDARLEDAKFFYNEDTKKKLEDYIDGLKDIVFQKELGTVYDKSLRDGKLAENIARYLELGDETIKNIKRASYLAKGDLVTKMVNEFTELQGIMGREYALKSGENHIVSTAIFEHYLPRFSGDSLPTTTSGAILGIADKIDTISGCFAIGLQPTGSQDPYGLRRQSLGIINIILDKNLTLPLSKLIDLSLDVYRELEFEFDYGKVKENILSFFKGRMKNMFIDMGIRYDVIDAVINTIDDVSDILLRANELNKWLEKEELGEILAAFNRVITMANKAENDDIDPSLLSEEKEKELYRKYDELKDVVKLLVKDKEYDKALDTLIELRQPIDEFFDNVMVMTDDKDIKNNRLALIKSISDMMLTICDLSRIVYSY
ncbi:glycine--tRNA ligase subunit beta [Clostridiisalibacter paucivorans]|uniref:glycine--tRNA ligase subunit beta n=1 Tax=Clostridiisalibacter paucivorans TaxID=408753 RepID=UPI00047D7437|nr:glycine--tRNA ligase subunit beta [Clostridiisalibacter paucivorans]